MKKREDLDIKTNPYLLQNQSLTKSIDENIKLFQNIFSNDQTLMVRHIQNRNCNLKCCVLYMEGMVDNNSISENIIKPFLYNNLSVQNNNLINILKSQVLISNDIRESNDIYQIIIDLIEGNTVFLLDGYDYLLIIGSKGWKSRSITEPSSEKVLRGPREGFTESLVTNLSLVRRRIKNPNLKFQFKEVGKETNTKICICYIEGITSDKILQELNKRLDEVSIYSVLDSQYIQEMIDDAPLSPFETVGSTERPDVVAGKILEGRIAIFVDGTPFVLTIPFLFMEYFQVSEDYYNNYLFMSFNRIIRVFSFVLGISIPAVYVAFITFNQEMIPTPLLLSISAAREAVPFPTFLEAFLMLLVFEILREAGSRIPTNMGQAVSIVGALVLGQAAVEARIVSAPMVIVVGLTGIVSITNLRINGATIFFRIIFLMLASFIGMYGYIFGIIGTIVYLMSLRSFGVPYMSIIGAIKTEYVKDSVIRVPWWYIGLRPHIVYAKANVARKKKVGPKNE